MFHVFKDSLYLHQSRTICAQFNIGYFNEDRVLIKTESLFPLEGMVTFSLNSAEAGPYTIWCFCGPKELCVRIKTMQKSFLKSGNWK